MLEAAIHEEAQAALRRALVSVQGIEVRVLHVGRRGAEAGCLRTGDGLSAWSNDET